MSAAEIRAALAEAEAELFAWATGKRSCTNEQMSVENYVEYANGINEPDRGQTLVRIAQRDAAETEGARQGVLALRLLAETATPPAPQTVSTVAELDALPVGVHLRLRGGLFATKYPAGWQVGGAEGWHDADYVIRGDAPAEVLYQPPAKPWRQPEISPHASAETL